jgi:hypothetical protein
MCPILSANWNNESNAGVWALNLNNVRTNANNNVGGRADSIPLPHRCICQSGIQGDAFRRVVHSTAKSAGFRFSGRAGDSLEGQAL